MEVTLLLSQRMHKDNGYTLMDRLRDKANLLKVCCHTGEIMASCARTTEHRSNTVVKEDIILLIWQFILLCLYGLL
jgi:hypothetical protein